MCFQWSQTGVITNVWVYYLSKSSGDLYCLNCQKLIWVRFTMHLIWIFTCCHEFWVYLKHLGSSRKLPWFKIDTPLQKTWNPWKNAPVGPIFGEGRLVSEQFSPVQILKSSTLALAILAVMPPRDIIHSSVLKFQKSFVLVKFEINFN